MQHLQDFNTFPGMYSIYETLIHGWNFPREINRRSILQDYGGYGPALALARGGEIFREILL